MGACNPQLTFDDAVVVSCEEHGLCPAGHVCLRGQRCVDERALDPNGASPIVPGNDSILDLNDTLVFAWSTVANAQTYTLEVSTDAAFTSYVAGTPRVVEGTTHIATLPEGTYFWRVTADITAEGVPATAVRFGILGDALHVACPADVDCSAPNDGTLELGTAALPFHSINRGIREAAARGLGTVRVAKRPDGLAYQESVYLLQGLALEGGYGMDFGSREGRTKVALDDIGLRASSILAPTRVEHFDFERTGDASTTSVAVSITNSNDALVLADVRMSATTWRNAILDVRSSDAERGPPNHRLRDRGGLPGRTRRHSHDAQCRRRRQCTPRHRSQPHHGAHREARRRRDTDRRRRQRPRRAHARSQPHRSSPGHGVFLHGDRHRQHLGSRHDGLHGDDEHGPDQSGPRNPRQLRR